MIIHANREQEAISWKAELQDNSQRLNSILAILVP